MSNLKKVEPTTIKMEEQDSYLKIKDFTQIPLINLSADKVEGLIRALKSLGYNLLEVDFALKNMNYTQSDDLSDLISKAIKCIALNEKWSA